MKENKRVLSDFHLPKMSIRHRELPELHSPVVWKAGVPSAVTHFCILRLKMGYRAVLSCTAAVWRCESFQVPRACVALGVRDHSSQVPFTSQGRASFRDARHELAVVEVA